MSVALVTGSSRGIGKAIAITLSQAGHHILINYNTNTDAAKNVLNEITENGGSAELLPFDISNQDDINNTISKWLDLHPEKTISILINNAGIRSDALMAMMDNKQWQDVINTNLNSFFHITKCLLNDMMMAKFGRIINVVSLSGIKGQAGQTNYAASKAGVIAATKSLAIEMARFGITVNAVAPGFISTEMTEDLDQKALSKLIPAKRFGTPQEVADLVAFLASEKSTYITGEVISINGGLYT